MKTVIIKPKSEEELKFLEEMLAKHQIEMEFLEDSDEEMFKNIGKRFFLEGYLEADSIYDTL